MLFIATFLAFIPMIPSTVFAGVVVPSTALSLVQLGAYPEMDKNLNKTAKISVITTVIITIITLLFL